MPRLVVCGTADGQNTATLLDRDGLLWQLMNEFKAHFISRAKKAEAFFKMSTS